MAARTKHPDQTWALLRCLSGPEGMPGLMSATGTPPANQHLLDGWYASYTLLPTAELKQAFEGALKYGKAPFSHAFVDAIHLRNLFDPILNRMWEGKAGISAALQNAQTAVIAALAPNVGKKVCVTNGATGVC